ncbi:MAG: hypothetical protein JWQ11_2502 [Rhizobacter sp.]|nr:hypothetical protein [Rhizobacter sp.]
MRSFIRPAAIVEAWFDNLRPEHQPVPRSLQATVLAAVPALTQAVKWGILVFLYRGLHALSIQVFKTHAHLQLFNGASLARSFPRLEGNGRGMRHLKWRHHDEIDEAMVRALAFACVGLIETGFEPGGRHFEAVHEAR